MFSLPARQASQRVEVWRKLRQLGALPLRSSGYLLPNTEQNRERFEWLAAAIRRYKGEASVAQVQAINDLPEEALVKMFIEARSKDYEALMKEIRKTSSIAPRATLTRLRQRFRQIEAMDYFDSPLRSRVDAALGRLESPHPEPPAKRARKEYRGRTWVTRPRPGIDRVSSAWLIRRFIDPQAKFAFDSGRGPAAAIPFDTFHDGGFGHRGEDCTFETLRKEFAIRDAGVAALAEMIHDADLEDTKFGRTEALGIDKTLIGWAKQGVSDDELLRRGMEMIEGLYQCVAESGKG